MPEESRWICEECGYIMYGSEPEFCEDCGDTDIREDPGDYDDEPEEPRVPWLTRGELWALRHSDT
jgi:hypothetical protein